MWILMYHISHDTVATSETMIDLAPNNPYGLTIHSPVLTAAGCFGYGVEYARMVDLTRIGAIVTRSTALHGRRAARPPQILETPAGLLSIGAWPTPSINRAIERYARVNVGIAVAGEGTLLVPTVFDAERRSLGSIATETRRLALAARDGALTPAELGGGTFTVSNLGMFGIQHFTAVLNPPQAAILAVGALETRPVGDGEQFVPRRQPALRPALGTRSADPPTTAATRASHVFDPRTRHPATGGTRRPVPPPPVRPDDRERAVTTRQREGHGVDAPRS